VVATSHSGHRVVVFRAATKRELVHWLLTTPLRRRYPNGVTIKRGGVK
jgi:hypothetical protein